MIQKEKILVLRTFKHGESDLIVHGLNPQGARQGFIAKGGAKSRKRFAGGILEATNYIEINYKVSARSDTDPLHTLLDANLIRAFNLLRTDYDRLNLALHVLKLVLKVSAPGVIDAADLFNLTGNALAAAETSQNLDRLRVHFELKLLALQGVLPHEDAFLPWIHTSLAKHEGLSDENWRWITAAVHDHLRHYLELQEGG